MVFGILAVGILGGIIGGVIESSLDATISSDKKSNKIVIALDKSSNKIKRRYPINEFPNNVPLDIKKIDKDHFYGMYNTFKNLLKQDNINVIFAFYKGVWQTERLGFHLKIYLPDHQLYDKLGHIIRKDELVSLGDYSISNEFTPSDVNATIRQLKDLRQVREVPVESSLPPVQRRTYRPPGHASRDQYSRDTSRAPRSRSDGNWRGGDIIYDHGVSDNRNTDNIEFRAFNEFFILFDDHKDNSEFFSHIETVQAGGSSNLPIYKSLKYHSFWMVPNVTCNQLYDVCRSLHDMVMPLFQQAKKNYILADHYPNTRRSDRDLAIDTYAIYFKLVSPGLFNVCIKFGEEIYPLLINKWFFEYKQSGKLFQYNLNTGDGIGPGYIYT